MQRAWENPTPLAHRVAAEMFIRVKRHEDALEHAREALELGPNDPENKASVARVLIFLGRDRDAIDRIEEAMSADRFYPAEYLYLRGLARFGLEQFDLAIADMLAVLARTPAHHRANAVLAASYGHLGRQAEAADALDAYWAAETAIVHHGRVDEASLRHWWPYAEEDDLDRLLDGVAKAGGSVDALPVRTRETELQ
jgi:adenylate cyclase